MKSHPRTARPRATGPVPREGRTRLRQNRSGVRCAAKAVVTATPPATTAATPPIEATRRAAGTSVPLGSLLARPASGPSGDRVGHGGDGHRSERGAHQHLAETPPPRGERTQEAGHEQRDDEARGAHGEAGHGVTALVVACRRCPTPGQPAALEEVLGAHRGEVGRHRHHREVGRTGPGTSGGPLHHEAWVTVTVNPGNCPGAGVGTVAVGSCWNTLWSWSTV